MDYKQIFGDSINELETVNGKHYALPYSMATYGLYYNKAMFDKAGVPYPTDDWTWDDLRAAALKLTSGSGASKTYGFLPDYTGQWAFLLFNSSVLTMSIKIMERNRIGTIPLS